MILIIYYIIKNKVVTTFKSNNNIYIVSFAHNCCKKAQANLEETGLKYGATKVFSLNLETLEAPDNVKKYITENGRGAGYWLWKPYALKQILKTSNKDDIVIYADAGTYFTKPLDNLLLFINTYSVLAFKHGGTGYDQNAWTKMNAVKYFDYNNNTWCETDGIKKQFIGSFVGIKNDEKGNFLVDTWLNSLTPDKSNLFDDTESNIPNCKEFQESRHDQQMLSLILYKYFNNIPFSIYSEDEYGFVRHKKINGNARHD
jgi:hypothetical protein